MVISRNGQVWCSDERRSGVLRAPGHPLNGLDFVELVREPVALRLDVTFLKPPPAGLVGTPAAFTVIGGVRIVGIRVLSVEPDPGDPLRLRVFLDREGDFSTYVLEVADPELDTQRSQARFSFKADCPSELDCRPRTDCPPSAANEPALDYLAKDYQSFRRLLLDLIPQRNPGWIERLPADVGIALVELLAYAGDYLSYYQDAAGTEGWLDSCLHRISAARHARLIDYRMHQGRNALTHIHFAAAPGTNGVVPAGTRLLTRVGQPLRGQNGAPGLVLPPDADFDADPALATATVFETTALTRVTDLHNALRIHTWSDAECCLARGAREAFLYGVPEAGANPVAFRPQLQIGDYLLLEAVRGPVTGAQADADPNHRQVVRLIGMQNTEDDAYRELLLNRQLTPRTNLAQAALPLQRVAWRAEDALGFTLCLSAETPEAGTIDPAALARGNLAPADHGRTLVRASDDLPAGPDAQPPLGLPSPGSGRWPLPWLDLTDAPLTHQPMPTEPLYAPDGRLIDGRHDLERDAREAAPAIVLTLTLPGGQEERWEPVPHLLDSGPFDQHFVAEIDNDGQARLRFGDDRFGRRPLDVERIALRCRIGNGRAGNLGAGALVHVVEPTAAELTDPANPAAGPAAFAAVTRLHQPLPARLGSDPETIEEVRQLAPEAFRAVQLRAVTEEDWQQAALRHPGVSAAKARFRWTGSWHTVFVAVHPAEAADLVRLAGGGAALASGFASEIQAHLIRFKLAGYDLAVRAARYVPLEIEIELCVARGHFRGDVLAAVADALSTRAFADGSRGFFHPLQLAFGQPVYLSRLYAAIEAIAGVDSARVTRFKRYWEPVGDALGRGLIQMGDLEIARLDNDPSTPENGVLGLTAVGGL